MFIRDRASQRLHISHPILRSETKPSVCQIAAALICVGMQDLSSRRDDPKWFAFDDPGKHKGSPEKRARSPSDDQGGGRDPGGDKGPKRAKTKSDKSGPSVSKGSICGRGGR